MKRENYIIEKEETVMRYGKLVSKNEVYQDYLKNEVIELDKHINYDFIEVRSSSTIFISRPNKDLLKLETLLNNIRTLQKAAKENNVKVAGVNKVRKWYRENYDNYQKEISLYKEIFEDLMNAWRETDLHIGISDDFFYKEVLQEKEFFLQKKLGFNSLNNKVEAKNNKVVELINDVKEGYVVSLNLM